MSGRPLPVADLAVGTVTARVIRGQLTNPVVGQTVDMVAGGVNRKATTDEAGRATFTGLAPGTKVKLTVDVGGERADSQEFVVPATGGTRLMLVVSEAGGTPAAPAARGSVVLGDQSRFVIEVGDDALNVFNMMQIVNTAPQPVDIGGPLVFDLPKSAVGAGLMEGSTPKAAVAGRKVKVNGPFPPGNTIVQFAYSLPLGDETITIEQKLPAPITQVSVIAEKMGQMQLASPQVSQRREMPAEGKTYVIGQGGAMQAGDTISLTFSGLPRRASWPRNVAIALALAIVGAGGWLAFRKAPAAAASASRQALQTRRDTLFAELARLEEQRRQGSIDADGYAGRRESLVTALEDLYRGLDREVA